MELTRRSLLKYLGLAPVAAVGATLAVKALTPPALPKMEVGKWEGVRFVTETLKRNDIGARAYVVSKSHHSFGTVPQAMKDEYQRRALENFRQSSLTRELFGRG